MQPAATLFSQQSFQRSKDEEQDANISNRFRPQFVSFLAHRDWLCALRPRGVYHISLIYLYSKIVRGRGRGGCLGCRRVRSLARRKIRWGARQDRKSVV